MDIYNLGSLMWEIIREKVPYSEDKDGGILQLILNIKNNEYREKDVTDAPSEYIELYKRCWVGNSLERPSINDVSKSLLSINVLDKSRVAK